MKREIFSVLFALVLMVSLGLVTQVIPTASASSDLPEVEFQVGEESSAEWTTEKYSGTYSVLLSTLYPTPLSHYARVATPYGDTLNSISGISYWEYYVKDWAESVTELRGVWVSIALDTGTYDHPGGTLIAPALDGVADHWLLGDPHLQGGWTPVGGAEPSPWPCTWSQWVERTFDEGSLFISPIDFPGTEWTFTLAEWKAGGVEAELPPYDGTMAVSPISGDSRVLHIKLAIGEGTTGEGWPTDHYKNVYVDDVTINGVPYDLEPRVINTTQTKGYNTIQGAVDEANALDTITVAAGTYYGSSTDQKWAIYIDKPITLLGAQAGVDARDRSGAETVIDATSYGVGIYVIGEGDHTVIDGFEVKNSGYVDERGAGIGLEDGADFVTIRNTYVHNNNNQGIQSFLRNSGHPINNNILIEKCRLEDNGDSGVKVYGSSHVTVQDNLIRNNEDFGVQVWDYRTVTGYVLDDVQILRNQFFNNGDTIKLDGGETSGIITNAVVAFNEIHSGQRGVYLRHNVASAQVYSNEFVDNDVQVYDDPEILDIGAVLTSNTFDRAVTVDHPEGSLLHTIWSKIQDAVDAAVDGDTISVAAGTYTENIIFPNKAITLQSTDPQDATVRANTIVDGGGSGSVFYFSNVHFGAILKGFTIQNGNASSYPNEGGGIRIEGWGPTIEYNTITNNSAKYGSGIHVEAANDAIIQHNSISYNDASSINESQGGGINTSQCHPTISGNTIAYNKAKYGAGIMSATAYPTISGNTIEHNTAGWEGGGIQITAGSATITGNVISNNNSVYDGGGIFAKGTPVSSATVTVTGNTIKENHAEHEGGGVFYSSGVEGSITGNNIEGNTATVLFSGMKTISTGIDATNNWWGTTTDAEVAAMVSGNVNYDPWHLKTITTLTANNPTESSVDLSWATTGAWDGDYFDVRYSTSAITAENWREARRVTGEPTPSATVNTRQGIRVHRLSENTTYHFGLKLIDKDIGSSDISNIVSATTLTTAPTDTTPPSAITADLKAVTGTPPTKKVILSWTAKGDDGTDGIASKYIIKQSTSEITAANFDSATTVHNNLRCKANGGSESFTVRRLTPNTTYYFAIKIQDEVPNTSAISKVVSITTSDLLPTVTGISPTNRDNGEARILTIAGTNFTSSGTTVMRFISGDNTFDLTTVVYASSTQLTGVVPIGAPTGTYKARVINNYGTSALSSATYTVAAAPTPLPVVTNLIPQMAASSTAVSGVKIFGKNFTGVTAVKVGDTTATSFTKISDTKITADVPGLTVGEYDVKVTTPSGTNSISAVKFRVSEPVVVNTDTTEDTTTSEVIDLGDTNVIPVQLTLTTDTAETATQATDTDAEIEVVIPPETAVTDSEGDDYTGSINPPRVVKADESVLSDLTEEAVVIEMGNPEETIRFDQDFVATITLTASHQPLIWYYNKTTLCYELAGKTGTKDGVSYIPGGIVINQAGTLYTMGLLLDHMSPYVDGVVPTVTGSPAEAPDGTNITITGTNFDEGQAQVYFDETPGTIVSRTTTQVVATVPKFIYREHSTDYILKVGNRDGQYDTTSIRLLNVPTLTPGGGTISVVGTLFGTVPGFPISDSGKVVKTIIAASADGNLSITIPAGTTALDKYGNPLSTLMSNVDPSLPQPPEGANIIGAAYDFGPPGTTFDPPIIFECTYDPAEIPEGVAEEDLVLAHYDEEAGEWVELPSTVDPVTHTVTASVCHFSTFAIIARAPAALPPAPAVFSVSSLSTQPVEVQPEEAVNIRVSVANTGGTAGSYTVVLMIDGVKEAEKSVTVADGSSQGVSFSVTRGDAGSYSVAVDGLSSSFVVVAPPAASPAELPINWLLLGGVIGGVIVVSLVIFVLRWWY